MKKHPRPRSPVFTLPIGVNKDGQLTLTCPTTGKTIAVVRNEKTIKYKEQPNDQR